MYGPKGYSLRDRARPLDVSPDKSFVFATYDSPETSIGSFDVRTQKTYPEVPIRGVVLDFPAEDRVLIGLFNSEGIIDRCQLFDYRLNPVGDEPQTMFFTGRDMLDGVSYELPRDVDEDGNLWSANGFSFRILKNLGQSHRDGDIFIRIITK